jgi:malonyl-CoA O-methyltransferase
MDWTKGNCSRPDKRRVRESFDRAAATYDQAAALQRTIGERLLARLRPLPMRPGVVVDVGAGTGACLSPLAEHYARSTVVALDIAEAMLRQARSKAGLAQPGRHFVCGDAERLPLATSGVDLIFSNLAVQWCDHLGSAVREFARALAPGGWLVFSTLGPGTLRELRASWSRVDGNSHVNAFQDAEQTAQVLTRAGFSDPEVSSEDVVWSYEDVFGLMRDLKSLGAHNVTHGRSRGLTGKRRIEAMREAYEQYRHHGLLPASYEVVYAHARRPERAPSWVAPRSMQYAGASERG